MEGNGTPTQAPPHDGRAVWGGPAVGKRCRELLMELGEGAGHGDVLERMRAQGGRVSYQCYEKHYRRHARHAPPGHRDAADKVIAPEGPPPPAALIDVRREVGAAAMTEVLGVAPAPPTPTTAQIMRDAEAAQPVGDFLHFAAAVERVGGLAKARELLNVIEHLGRVL